MTKTNKLKALRMEKGLRQEDVCKQLKMSTQSYTRKESGKYDFKQTEIILLAKMLNLSCEQIIDIFFDVELNTNDNFSVCVT